MSPSSKAAAAQLCHASCIAMNAWAPSCTGFRQLIVALYDFYRHGAAPVCPPPPPAAEGERKLLRKLLAIVTVVSLLALGTFIGAVYGGHAGPLVTDLQPTLHPICGKRGTADLSQPWPRGSLLMQAGCLRDSLRTHTSGHVLHVLSPRRGSHC